ncbi:peptidoglycan editing factor PgeF [Paenibacillus donghaensis]|uniref:peptidoglycan editing factor PgeF n=1 Tax=Paenibacillus donghaensis TaxID=414771 RepID=UPI0018846089|nr:peptidoglycan editing factor PgeF [Paenibacillus donghaensis]MBE9912748.1 peptidoglycan editing factor PgeF [Paenibacillus donghaensis]
MEPFVLREAGDQPALFMLESWMSGCEELTAGFTGRNGGVGQAPYDTLNCAFHVGDRPEDVIANRKLVAAGLGFEIDAWTCGEQVHRADITVIDQARIGAGNLNRESAIQDTDGLLTNMPGVLLTSFYADCVPLFFLDPKQKAVGLAHAGWKGTVAKIAVKMTERMQEAFGSRPEDIRAAIGPSIGSCCYEVDGKVMSHVHDLEKNFLGNGDDHRPDLYTAKNNGKFMLNLKELNRHIMIKAGILPTHIECTSYCTSCRNDLFFSYRKDGGTTGRMASWIGLKER